MNLAEITMKSGATVSIEVLELTTKRNGLGEFIGIDWRTPPGGDILTRLNIEAVDVIIVRRSPEDEVPSD